MTELRKAAMKRGLSPKQAIDESLLVLDCSTPASDYERLIHLPPRRGKRLRAGFVTTMAVELRLKPEAERDLSAAWAWYEQRHRGLGDDFLAAIDACLARIQERPLLAPLVHGEFRRALPARFPYAIFCRADEQAVTVYAMFHMARNPRKWQRRMGRRGASD